MPWQALRMGFIALAVVLVAFRWPTASETPTGAAADAVLADGATLEATKPSVTSPPEQQPSAELPLPGPGEEPVQTVVVSIDGGCETPSGTIADFLDVADAVDARMSFFLAGLCLLPESQRSEYLAPHGEPGQSDIPFADASIVATRVETFDRMWRSGHEISTHFLGHFCGEGGVKTWSTQQWRDELIQARKFLDRWRDFNPQAASAPALPFDSSAFVGSRTPCLEGARPAMHRAFEAEGLRYDASDPGVLQWPQKSERADLWLYPLPALKLAGTDRWVLSMDYNLMVNQTDGELKGDPQTCRRVEEQTYETYMDALDAVYRGNRAPLVVGSHLNDWLCGSYITAIKRFMQDAKQRYPDVRMVSFADLTDWLEALPPELLVSLQRRSAERY